MRFCLDKRRIEPSAELFDVTKMKAVARIWFDPFVKTIQYLEF